MRNVRELALDAIDGVLSGGKKPREVIENLSAGLGTRDRAFLMETAYGVLRLRDRMDWIVDSFLKKPSAVRGRTRDNLRLGAYQIFHMRVPEWAAVDEAVRLEQRKPTLVNAVLRNIIRNKGKVEKGLEKLRATTLDESAPPAEKASALSVLTSHPRWLVRRWIKRFGAAEALSLAEANNRVPPLTLRVNTLTTSRDAVIRLLAEKGIPAEPTRFSPDGVKLKGTHPIGEIAEFLGRVYIQDEAAQLVALMLAPRPGERVLDACAAPGGKATHIAQLMGDRGEVVALDIDDDRMKTLKKNISMMGLSCVRALKGDITAMEDLGPFDRVLVDAPCTSTGVIRRNPDVKYRRHAGDLEKFREKQLGILRSASRFLRPGGLIVYCTCSTEPEEGEQVVEEFLKTSGDFFNIKGVPVGEVYMRTYPHRHGMDGFFGARMERRK